MKGTSIDEASIYSLDPNTHILKIEAAEYCDVKLFFEVEQLQALHDLLGSHLRTIAVNAEHLAAGRVRSADEEEPAQGDQND